MLMNCKLRAEHKLNEEKTVVTRREKKDMRHYSKASTQVQFLRT